VELRQSRAQREEAGAVKFEMDEADEMDAVSRRQLCPFAHLR
jgi:hypothetical protein